MLNRQETRFLNAMSAYLKGTPIISDEEFDALKVHMLYYFTLQFDIVLQFGLKLVTVQSSLTGSSSTQ
jgi:hypothetical protein